VKLVDGQADIMRMTVKSKLNQHQPTVYNKLYCNDKKKLLSRTHWTVPISKM